MASTSIQRLQFPSTVHNISLVMKVSEQEKGARFPSFSIIPLGTFNASMLFFLRILNTLVGYTIPG